MPTESQRHGRTACRGAGHQQAIASTDIGHNGQRWAVENISPTYSCALVVHLRLHARLCRDGLALALVTCGFGLVKMLLMRPLVTGDLAHG